MSDPPFRSGTAVAPDLTQLGLTGPAEVTRAAAALRQ
jgi:hypothetical protein